jgi:pimeloyl-ACP methyl ester carboxylesterase
MFAGLRRRGMEWLAADRAKRVGNSAAGLAATLRLLGQGTMPFLGDRLGELRVPVTLVVGERDEHYRETAGRMATALPEARLVVVPGAGHAVVGEDPGAVAEVLQSVVADEHTFD